MDDCVDVLMIAKYLEQIGDHASNICEWTEFNEQER
ncbi:MAG: PhoU domain-containing protein [Lachnospiraceae bacterium]